MKVASYLYDLMVILQFTGNTIQFSEGLKNQLSDLFYQQDEQIVAKVAHQKSQQQPHRQTRKDAKKGADGKESLQGNSMTARIIRTQWLTQEIATFKSKEVPSSVVEELRIKLLTDGETREAAEMIHTSRTMTLFLLVDGINDYISSLNDEDGVLRIKDVVIMDDSKFVLDPKPIQLLLL